MSLQPTPTGVLLVNLGTPASPAARDVRRFLREFLSDGRVLDLPGPLRRALLELVILPLRPRRSAAAYRKIWTPAGSPLLVHGRALGAALAAELGDGYRVVLAMRYGEPSLARAFDDLLAARPGSIVVLPLFPQYAASSTGSVLAELYRLAARRWDPPTFRVLEGFCEDPRLVKALAGVAAPHLSEFQPDYVLFSFHGLPERQIRKSDASRSQCLTTTNCCDAIGPVNRGCYRAQCHATAHALAAALGLAPERWSVAFQSRLGPSPWIRPQTDLVLPELAARGIRRLAVACPSFAADCLETLEEIGLRAAEQWRHLGGQDFRLLPCPNAHPAWVAALAEIVRSAR